MIIGDLPPRKLTTLQHSVLFMYRAGTGPSIIAKRLDKSPAAIFQTLKRIAAKYETSVKHLRDASRPQEAASTKG